MPKFKMHFIRKDKKKTEKGIKGRLDPMSHLNALCPPNSFHCENA